MPTLLQLTKVMLIAIAAYFEVLLSERISKDQMANQVARLVSTSSRQMRYMRDLGWKYNGMAGAYEYAFKGAATDWITRIVRQPTADLGRRTTVIRRNARAP